MRESAIERYLKKRVEEAGGICYKFVSPGRRNVPDRLVLLPGFRPLFVEVKAPSKKLRPGQLREVERLQQLGQLVWPVDSIADVDILMQTFADGRCKTVRRS